MDDDAHGLAEAFDRSAFPLRQIAQFLFGQQAPRLFGRVIDAMVQGLLNPKPHPLAPLASAVGRVFHSSTQKRQHRESRLHLLSPLANRVATAEAIWAQGTLPS